MQEAIYNKLKQTLNPSQLEVVNESHLHSGHSGDDGSGESHFHVIIVSPLFEGKTRLARERMVYKALSEEMKRIHALSMKIVDA